MHLIIVISQVCLLVSGEQHLKIDGKMDSIADVNELLGLENVVSVAENNPDSKSIYLHNWHADNTENIVYMLSLRYKKDLLDMFKYSDLRLHMDGVALLLEYYCGVKNKAAVTSTVMYALNCICVFNEIKGQIHYFARFMMQETLFNAIYDNDVVSMIHSDNHKDIIDMLYKLYNSTQFIEIIDADYCHIEWLDLRSSLLENKGFIRHYVYRPILFNRFVYKSEISNIRKFKKHVSYYVKNRVPYEEYRSYSLFGRGLLPGRFSVDTVVASIEYFLPYEYSHKNITLILIWAILLHDYNMSYDQLPLSLKNIPSEKLLEIEPDTMIPSYSLVTGKPILYEHDDTFFRLSGGPKYNRSSNTDRISEAIYTSTMQ